MIELGVQAGLNGHAQGVRQRQVIRPDEVDQALIGAIDLLAMLLEALQGFRQQPLASTALLVRKQMAEGEILFTEAGIQRSHYLGQGTVREELEEFILYVCVFLSIDIAFD